MYRYAKALLITSLVTGSMSVFAHAGFKPKDVNDNYDGRTYLGGQTAYLSVTVPHGCKGENGEQYATNHVGMVLPTMVALPAEQSSTTDKEGNQYGANAMMGIRVAIDSNWETVRGLRGEVSEFYSHGAKTEDVHAVHWLGGELPYDMYTELKFRATLPKLTGCVTKLRVYTPIIQYCEGNHYKVWTSEATTAFPEDKVSVGYTPYIDVARDLAANPLDESCGEGEELKISPPADKIDWYLSPRKDY